ncbi:TonB-dependent receptor [Flavobacteriaceae bacterium Ap0902]|nr:TonB-dependent receptor [Flavobacteriaceae bacterium Ap0902]
MYKYILYILVLSPIGLIGQIITLDSLYVKGDEENKREDFHKTQILSDSVKSNAVGLSLTEVLREQTPIFFKESGAGMISSVSFRGTTAQHTAVLWNGLNINSQLLGQTDFNAVSLATADEMHIEYGSGGTESGSGAIGGTVSLYNTEKFHQPDQQNIQLGYGSFNHFLVGYNYLMSNDNSFFSIQFYREQSDNDYEIPERNYKNINGDFWKNDISFNLGYQWKENHKLLFYNEVYNDKRNFALILPTETPSKYYNFNFRHLVRYIYTKDKLRITPEVGFLKERYRYYPDISLIENSGNGVGSLISKLKTEYKIWPRLNLEMNGGFNYRENFPEGNTMGKIYRREATFSARTVYSPTKYLKIEGSGRKEWIGGFSSPYLYAVVLNINPIKRWFIKLKTATSFRAPSFNDLYWQPGGNPDLKSEFSESYEISSEYKMSNFHIGVNVFHQEIEDMIRWIPGRRGYWEAFNVDEVKIDGVEANLHYHFNLAGIRTDVNGFLGYTDARDAKEDLSLMYVPPLKMGFNLGFSYKNFSIGWNNRFVDDIYFSVGKDEDSKVEKYYLNNIIFKYKMLDERLQLYFKINNLNNKIYRSLLNRYQPTRNFNLKISYEIF